MITKLSFLLMASSGVASVVADAESAEHPFVRGGSNHRELQLPPLSCSGGGFVGPCCGPTLCWCANPWDDICPAYPQGRIYGDNEVSSFFSSLFLDNPGYDYLQLCHPKLSCGFGNPHLLFDEDILDEAEVDTCRVLRSNDPSSTYGSSSSDECSQDEVSSSSSGKNDEDEVCGIKVKRSGNAIDPKSYDTDCSSASRGTNYKVKNFENDEEREDAGYFLLHEGGCGVCSTAQDLASYMKYSFPTSVIPPYLTLASLSLQCYFYNAPTNPLPADLVSSVRDCLQHGVNVGGIQIESAGLSANCAYSWAINVYLSSRPVADGGCQEKCSAPEAPYDTSTCELNECLQCDDNVSGDTFIELAGMTRRGAAIHTALPRPCGSLASHVHTCVAEL